MKCPILPVILILILQLPGCVNVIDGSAETRIRKGRSERIPSSPVYSVYLTDGDQFAEENQDQLLERPRVRMRATRVETVTIHTPRSKEQVELILPYSLLREAPEFLSFPFTMFWALFTANWGDWFAMVNPALNSEAMWRGSVVERITDSIPIDPQIEVSRETDRIAAEIDLRLDALPPYRVMSAGEGLDTQVDLIALLTAPLFEAPETLRAAMQIGGEGEPWISTMEIEPEFGDRILRGQPFLLDPSSGRHTPAELANAILRLGDLGFSEWSVALRSKSSLIFGTETMDREIAREFVRLAEERKNEGNWGGALEALGLARGLDGRAHPDWDQLEADVFEKQALEALGAGQYAQARSGLLKATTIDSGRQPRLAPFITMSIEASDRAADREATQRSRDALLAIEREKADAEAKRVGARSPRPLEPVPTRPGSGS